MKSREGWIEPASTLTREKIVQEKISGIDWEVLKNPDVEAIANSVISQERHAKTQALVEEFRSFMVLPVTREAAQEFFEAAAQQGLASIEWLMERGFGPILTLTSPDEASFKSLMNVQETQYHRLTWDAVVTLVLRAEQMQAAERDAEEVALRFNQFLKKPISNAVRWIVVGDTILQALSGKAAAPASWTASPAFRTTMGSFFSLCFIAEPSTRERGTSAELTSTVLSLQANLPLLGADLDSQAITSAIPIEAYKENRWAKEYVADFQRFLLAQMKEVSIQSNGATVNIRTLSNPLEPMLTSWEKGAPIVAKSATGITLAVPAANLIFG